MLDHALQCEITHYDVKLGVDVDCFSCNNKNKSAEREIKIRNLCVFMYSLVNWLQTTSCLRKCGRLGPEA